MLIVQARCKACLKTFTVHYEGKTALKKHMNSEIHRVCMKSFGNNTLITSTSSSAGETQKISAMEGTLMYHEVKHGHSYIFQQYTIKLVKGLFASSSTVAKKDDRRFD